jgi:hypothetical protein
MWMTWINPMENYTSNIHSTDFMVNEYYNIDASYKIEGVYI